MAAHVVGSAAGQVSPREFVRQKRKGKPVTAEIGGQFWWDGMNEVQVRERASLTTGELIAEWEATSPRAIKARTKLPRLIADRRLLKLPIVGKQPLSYLFDVGFTRDVWMHRVDIAHAIGYGLDFDADHDGRLMEDYVAEWASVYDTPFTLHLTGPGGRQLPVRRRRTSRHHRRRRVPAHPRRARARHRSSEQPASPLTLRKDAPCRRVSPRSPTRPTGCRRSSPTSARRGSRSTSSSSTTSNRCCSTRGRVRCFRS